jgi:hypothetical protein
MKIICSNSKAHCEYESDNPREWAKGCPACKTSKPPLVFDVSKYHDAGEIPKKVLRRPMQSDKERTR